MNEVNFGLVLEGIRRELAALRGEMQKRQPPARALYKLSEAAKELGVGMTKLRQLVKERVVLVVELGGRDMVPASEIARLSQVERPKVALSPKAQRLAASLAKVREPLPGGREAALRARNRKHPGQSQDFSRLDALLKGKPKKVKR